MARIAIPSDGEFGSELCKVLGLDPKKTKNIIIICKVDAPVMIQTISYLMEDESGGVLKLIKKYHLEEDGKKE